MTRDAERHVSRAAAHIERGEGYYLRAAEEIVAAKAAGATWAEIGDGLGRSASWCKRIAAWVQTPAQNGSPDTVDWQRGSHATVTEIRDGAAKLLRTAPLEEVEQLVSSLPKERQQAIAAAAGHGYAKARQEHDEAQRRLTPAERRERDEARERLTRPARQVAAAFTGLGIVEYIERATEELRELTADASVTPQLIRKLERADEAWREAVEFARALVGSDER